jgi:hypothetical protein
MFDEESICWSDDMTLHHFVEKYAKCRLPKLIRTTSGHSAGSNINDVCSDEVRSFRNNNFQLSSAKVHDYVGRYLLKLGSY